MAESTDLEMVRLLLAAQGIDPPAEDLAAIASGYPALRARAASLYTIECGDSEPALVLRALEADGS